MADHPRLPIHYLLNPDFGVSPDVPLRILSGDGKVEGELKAHGVILALGSSVLKEILFSKSGELISWKVVEVRGGIKKKTGFFQKNSERGGGGSRRIQNFLIRKN